MSNVIKAAASFSGTEQPALIGKIYEEQFTDSSGNTMVRYLRCFKAGSAVTKGQVVGSLPAAGPAMHTTGSCKPAETTSAEKQNIMGVALATVASGSYGFCVCRGVVEGVSALSGITIGELVQVGATDGSVDDIALSASVTAESNKVIGMALTATSSDAITMYIDVL